MPRKVSRRNLPQKRVYFKLDTPEAKEVVLSGSFNNWETDSKRLKQDRKGVWRTWLMLEPGVYEYRFVVDGQWQNDPDAEVVPNAYGAQNSVRIVS